MLAGQPETYPKPQEGIWLTLSPKRLAHPGPKSDAGFKTVTLKMHVGSERAGQARNRETQGPEKVRWQTQK